MVPGYFALGRETDITTFASNPKLYAQQIADKLSWAASKKNWLCLYTYILRKTEAISKVLWLIENLIRPALQSGQGERRRREKHPVFLAMTDHYGCRSVQYPPRTFYHPLKPGRNRLFQLRDNR